MNHFKHESLEGLSTTNIVYDKDAVIGELATHDNADEILAVLGESIDREDNGFRNIKTRDKVDHEGDAGYQVSLVESSTHSSAKSDPLHQLISDDSGTSQIMEHCHQYLGDNRAWRNGWNPKSYQRHAKATRKAQADNGVVWGAFSDLSARKTKLSKVASKLAALEAKQAKRKAKKG